VLCFLVSYYDIFFLLFFGIGPCFWYPRLTYFLWHPIFSMAPKLQNVPWPIFSFQCSFTCKAEELRACVLIFSLIEAAFLHLFLFTTSCLFFFDWRPQLWLWNDLLYSVWKLTRLGTSSSLCLRCQTAIDWLFSWGTFLLSIYFLECFRAEPSQLKLSWY